jgi:hypothetical protein
VNSLSERRAFLTPKNFQEDDQAEIPSLDEFDAEINIYRVFDFNYNSVLNVGILILLV